MRKRLLILSSALLLMACGAEGTDEDSPSPTDEDTTEQEVPVETETGDDNGDTETETDEPEDVETDNPGDVDDNEDGTTNQTDTSNNPLANIINEKTFVDDYAMQAWEDYKALTAEATYVESTIMYEENPDFSIIDGTSLEEITNHMDEINIREDVFRENLELNEMEQIYYYRYPAEEDSEFSEISDFLAEMSFYYLEDQLLLTSVTPGYYQVELGGLAEAESLMTFLTVDEIKALDAQVLTVAEMKVNGNLIQQVMLPAAMINEEGEEEILAFYFFTHGEDIVQYAYLPFETVMQSFPDYAVLVYQQIIPNIAELDL